MAVDSSPGVRWLLVLALGLLITIHPRAARAAAPTATSDQQPHRYGPQPPTAGQPRTNTREDQAARSAAGPSGPASAGPLSLDQLERMALQSNPTLSQATAQVEAAGGRALQAGLYPNPTVGYIGDHIGERRASGRAGAGLEGGFVQQQIVTGGKLGLSRATFAQERKQAQAWRRAQQLRVLAAVRSLYHQVLVSQATTALQQRLVQVAQESGRTTRQLQNIGQADRPDVLQTEVEARRARIALDAERKRYRALWQRLAAVVGRPGLSPTPLTGSLSQKIPALEWQSSLARLLAESPELQAARAGVCRAQFALRRAEVEPIPNVTAQAAVEHSFTQDNTQATVQVGIPLPVFDRNQGNILAAHAELIRAQREVQRVELSLRDRLAEALRRYQTARQQADEYWTSILPKARESYELYLRRYRQMAAGFPQVLAAQRSYFQASLEYVSALQDLWQAVVAVESLLLSDGLTAPPAPGAGLEVRQPGVETTTGELPGVIQPGQAPGLGRLPTQQP